MAITPTNPQRLYVALWGGGVYKTTDGGGHWTSVSTGLPKGGFEATASDLVVAPTAPGTLYAATANGMYKSSNSGGGWQLVENIHGYYSVAISPVNHKVVYAGSVSAGTFRSLDGGVTWSEINAGMPLSSP